MGKVLVVATSRKTRGGITSVIKAHETGKQWKKFHCRWIETTRDGPAWRKIWYFITALLEYTILLPFYDIVHIHLTASTSAKRKKIFFELAKFLHKKTIFHFHPSSEKILFEPANNRLLRNLFSRADLIIVLSEQWRIWLNEALGQIGHITVLYNPCPIVNRKPMEKQKEILFAGTIIPRKGYADLIRAFADIASRHKDWKLIIAGNGELDKAQQLVRYKGIANQVYFPGWITGRAKANAFNRASIFCLTSDGEGFPMAVLDAWAYGVPCVVTPVGGLPDIVKDGENALGFPIGDIKKLASQLERLINDEKLREKISETSLELANTIFNVQTITQRLDSIYTKLSKQ